MLMEVESRIMNATRKTKQFLFVLFFWTVSFLFLLNLPTFQISSQDIINFPSITFPKNEFGPITLTEYDDFRKFKIHFDKLASFPGDIGLFTTSTYKKIIITNLEIVVATGNEIEVIDPSKSDKKKSFHKVEPKEPASAPKDIASLLDEMKWAFRKNIQSVSREKANSQISFTLKFPNCENAAEFTANGFKFSWHDNSNIKYMIESKRANYSLLDSSAIQLQGHVVLKTKDATLESNSVSWDIHNNRFEIKGAYVLDNQNNRTLGRDISVDSQLNKISTLTKLVHNGETVCLVEK